MAYTPAGQQIRGFDHAYSMFNTGNLTLKGILFEKKQYVTHHKEF
jgi:hypothetical protein